MTHLPCIGHAASGVRSAQTTLPLGLKRHQGHNARSPVAHLDELLPINHIGELFPSTQKDELLLSTLTSPSLQLRWTGSSLQLVLTSSSPNSDGRAPTVHSDEPFTTTQMDGFLPINHIDELFPRHRGRAPTIHIDELFPSTQMDKLPLYTLTSPSL